MWITIDQFTSYWLTSGRGLKYSHCSLTHNGGLFLLSFMCFLATSVKLLISYFMIIDLNSTVNTNHCDNINVAEHAVLGVTAGLCLLVFVVPLMVLQFCSLYHLMAFQQCLTWFKFDRPGLLHALVDAYQGCFKNSATDGIYKTEVLCRSLPSVSILLPCFYCLTMHSLYLSQCMPYFLIMMNLLHFAFISE